MREMWNESSGVRLAWQVAVADTFWSRLCGWMGKREFPLGEALWIKPCKGVHTFFMRAPIDVVFLDREGRVVEMVHSLKPNRVVPLIREATTAVELPAGTLLAAGVRLRDRVVEIEL
jgi:uncharacterized membrane protein (UPF0127 family)